MVKGPTAEDLAAFDAIWTTLEGARIDRERGTRPQPEDKLKPIFRKGRDGYETFYIEEARGYQWQCWCVSEYVNAAGYFLMWKRGRKNVSENTGALRAGELVESDIQAAKDRSVLMRRVEKHQQASYALGEKRSNERAKRLLKEEAEKAEKAKALKKMKARLARRRRLKIPKPSKPFTL